MNDRELQAASDFIESFSILRFSETRKNPVFSSLRTTESRKASEAFVDEFKVTNDRAGYRSKSQVTDKFGAVALVTREYLLEM